MYSLSLHSFVDSNPLIREGSLIIEPRQSVVNNAEAKADTWEANTGAIESEGDPTMEFDVSTVPPPQSPPPLPLSNEPLPAVPSSPPRAKRPSLSLSQSLFHSFPRGNPQRQTLISESRLVAMNGGRYTERGLRGNRRGGAAASRVGGRGREGGVVERVPAGEWW